MDLRDIKLKSEKMGKSTKCVGDRGVSSTLRKSKGRCGVHNFDCCAYSHPAGLGHESWMQPPRRVNSSTSIIISLVL